MPASALTGTDGAWRRRTLSSLGIAVAARLVAGPLPLNYYDVGYALVWGREILGGHLPEYRTPGASTPHPLGTLLATLAAAFGTSAGWYVVQAILFVSLGVAGTALFVLTRICLAHAGAGARAATAGGALAVAALLFTRPFLTDAVGGSGLSDLPALALVLAAAALLAAQPGRSRGPLVLIGLAGLLRPEAWGLAGAFWVHLALRGLPRRQLVEAAVLVAAAPVVWAVCDVIVVGDAVYSLTHTQAASHTGFFAHGIGQVPRAAGRGLRALVGLPVLVLGAAGALVALGLACRATAPALALLGLALAEFAALGVANVPLLERFLLIVAAMICLFFAYAVVGARDRVLGHDHPRLKLAWTGLAVLVVAYVAAQHLSGVVHVRADQRTAVHAEADLLALARRPEVRAAVGRCQAFYVPRFTLTSLVAYDFDLPPQTILRTAAKPPARGLILIPVTAPGGAFFGVTRARLDALRRFTASRPISQNRSWRLVARGCP